MPEIPTPSRFGQLRTAAAVIYGTLASLLFAVPQSVSSWLKEGTETVVLQALLLPPVNLVDRISTATGAKAPFLYLRQNFLSITNKEEGAD